MLIRHIVSLSIPFECMQRKLERLDRGRVTILDGIAVVLKENKPDDRVNSGRHAENILRIVIKMCLRSH